ncbi:acyl-coenzyme A thioesterase 2, mitochondrial-like [Clarias gariepinus]|uniref:acyl-coenzyme A thioesterase 2, mitochondrial-like n=1 Tax=Clarias gariepinus TaxID=13013 RepID=UPI00234DFA78|nr:acyl-coenzyme A thioesterase 2, mitochondrial-like [Clarias gariepinus]
MALFVRARELFRISARALCSSGVQLRVLPSSSCFFDEAVQIKLSGLPPGRHVELRAKHQDDKGVVFRAAATYQADARGEVDVSRQPSTGGSYTGVEPMGLFWSMLPESPHKKLLKRDASSPVLVHIEAHGDGQVLTQGTNERRFMADGVKRVPVRDGRLRGTLFIPPGEGPFPGIIDLYTLGGTVCEPRAALLANKGFVVFALAFYGYQDMPKTVNTLDLEYFEEGLKFLQMQDKVKKIGMGILSISKSGDLALSMASFLPNISATVCINTCTANVMFPLHYKDMVIPGFVGSKKRITVTESGILDIRDILNDPMKEEKTRATVIPIERAGCKFLFLVSGDDRNWNSAFFAAQACSRLEAHGKANYDMVSYPKAGHFLEVPFMPHCPSGLHAAVDQVVVFGGEPKAHAHAQVDAWSRVQEFFRNHL